MRTSRPGVRIEHTDAVRFSFARATLASMSIKGLEPIDGVWLLAEEFRERCFSRLLTLKSEQGGREELLRLSTPRAKKLSEELMPIAAYADFHRRDDFEIRWLGGCQGYDAEIRSRNPALPEHLEVTIAVPGNEHLYRENSANAGRSFSAKGITRDRKTRQLISVPVVEEHSDYLRELQGLVQSVVEAKLKKSYPTSTSLIVQFRLDRVLLRHEFDDIAQRLRTTPVDPDMRFREVLVIEPYEFRAAAL